MMAGAQLAGTTVREPELGRQLLHRRCPDLFIKFFTSKRDLWF